MSSLTSQRFARTYELTVLAVFALLIAWQLYIPPSLGMGDNGDFAKLAGRYCLGHEHPEQNPYFDYADFTYTQAPQNCWNSELPTSAHVPVLLATAIGRVIFPNGRFDVRLLGLIYALIFLGSFHAWQRSLRARCWSARTLAPAGAVVIFGSATYIPWFNTFYFDAASFVFLMASVAALGRIVFSESVHWPEYALAWAVLILFATSKSQHSLLALAALPCFWFSFGRPFPSRWVRAAGTAAIVLSVGFMLASPAYYQTTNLYNALFYRALPHVVAPAADIADLGLSSEYIQYVGHHAFEPGSPTDDPQKAAELGRRLSPLKTARYYATHPAAAWGAFLQAMTEGSLIRARMTIGPQAFYLGNYTQSLGGPPNAQSRFLDVWTHVKIAMFGWRPGVYLGYAALLLVVLWIVVLRQSPASRKQAIALAASLTAAIMAAPLLVLFDGLDTGRHLFVYNTLLDVTVCAIIAAA